MHCGIYQIKNTKNGKRYVGSTIFISRRTKYHMNALKANKHHSRYLQRAWNKYGEGAFEFKPLLYCDKSNLLFYEQRAIDTYQSANGGGYNLSPTAGSSLGAKHSKATKRKMSETRKGHPSWSKGKKHTEEARKKMSRAQTGRMISPEHRRKISEALKGRPGAFKGRTHTEETRRKISETNKGRTSWHKGKKRTEETRRKISEAGKESWRRRKLSLVG